MMFRNSIRFVRNSSRFFSGRSAAAGAQLRAVSRPLAVGVGLGVACLAYTENRKRNPNFIVYAAENPVQPSVYSQTKQHALYLTIHLKPSADKKACARTVAKIQKLVDKVSPPADRDEEDEIWAGVGFSHSFYSSLASSGGLLSSITGGAIPKKDVDFSYEARSGPLGEMPATGGDIFIHAKSHDQGKLFELCEEIHKSLPPSSVQKFEDIYSFVYRSGRDLSGFIDGTENPADDDDRKSVAVEPGTHGSYVITQRWIHDHSVIRGTRDNIKESWVGRAISDSTELKQKEVTSHVARMTGGTAFDQPKKFQIVRQSMPYGSLGGESGLFFIAYAASPENFNYMLDRMVGKGEDAHSDNIMRLSKCVAGNFWYFPSVSELGKI